MTFSTKIFINWVKILLTILISAPSRLKGTLLDPAHCLYLLHFYPSNVIIISFPNQLKIHFLIIFMHQMISSFPYQFKIYILIIIILFLLIVHCLGRHVHLLQTLYNPFISKQCVSIAIDFHTWRQEDSIIVYVLLLISEYNKSKAMIVHIHENFLNSYITGPIFLFTF